MPEVENKPKNLVKNRSPQGHFEGQDSLPLTKHAQVINTYQHIAFCPENSCPHKRF